MHILFIGYLLISAGKNMHIMFRALAHSYFTIYSLIEEKVTEGQIKNIQNHSDSDERARSEFAIALSEFSTLPNVRIPILLNTLKNQSSKMIDKILAIRELSRQPELSENLRLALEAALQDDNKAVKFKAAIALSRHRALPDANVQILLTILQHKIFDEVQRVNAVWALGHQLTLSKVMRSALKAILQDDNENVRFRAAVALNAHNMLPNADIHILLDALKNKSGTAYRSEMEMVIALQEDCQNVRAKAAWVLGKRPTLLKASRLALEVALQDDDKNVRFQAAIALAAYNMLPDADIYILLDGVRNENFSVVRKVSAVRVLSKQLTLSKAGRSVLEAALQDSVEEVRLEAAIELGRRKILPDDEGMRILLHAVKNKSCSNEARRAHAAWVLSEQPELSADIHLALRDKDEEVRVQAAIALDRNVPPNADCSNEARRAHAATPYNVLPDADVQLMLGAIQNKIYSAVLRAQAAWILGQLQTLSKASQRVLEVALQDDDEDIMVRAQAAIALDKYSKLPNAGIPILLEAVKNKSCDAVLRIQAAWVLGSQATLSEAIHSALKEVLQDEDNDEDVRVQAILSLDRYGMLPSEGIPILLDAVKNKSCRTEEHRACAARVLSELPDLSEDIRLALRDKDEEVRVQAAIELDRNMRPNASIQTLVDTLQNKSCSAAHRADAAWTLGEQLKLSKAGCSALEAALQDDDENVRIEAVIALGKYVRLPNAGIPILLDAMKNKSCSVAHRAHAAWTLGEQPILFKVYCLALETALKDDDKSVRFQAAIALGRHGQLSDADIFILPDGVRNKDFSVMRKVGAIRILGEQPRLSKAGRLALEAALQDNDKEIRLEAAMALRRCK